VELKECERSVNLSDEGTAESGHLALIPASRFANLRACLLSKPNAQHRLIALLGSHALFVRLLIIQEVRTNGIPSDRGTWIGSVFSSACLDDRPLGLVQRERAGTAPQGIPDLLDERESLADGHTFDIDSWILHATNLRGAGASDNCPQRSFLAAFFAFRGAGAVFFRT